MIIRPQYTLDPTSAQIWPLDPWSRKLILQMLKDHMIEYDDSIPTTMGTTAVRFISTDVYSRVVELLKNFK